MSKHGEITIDVFFFNLIGMPLGNIAGFAVSGFLCDSGFVGGWPSIFYVFGKN